MILMQIDPIQIVDKAAQASDRWLFLGAVGLLIFGGLWLIRYLVGKIETLQKEHNVFMGSLFKETVTLTAQVSVVLQENTDLLNRISTRMDDNARPTQRVPKYNPTA